MVRQPACGMSALSLMTSFRTHRGFGWARNGDGWRECVLRTNRKPVGLAVPQIHSLCHIWRKSHRTQIQIFRIAASFRYPTSRLRCCQTTNLFHRNQLAFERLSTVQAIRKARSLDWETASARSCAGPSLCGGRSLQPDLFQFSPPQNTSPPGGRNRIRSRPQPATSRSFL